MTVAMSDGATSTVTYDVTLTNSPDDVIPTNSPDDVTPTDSSDSSSGDSVNIVDCTDSILNTIMVPKDQSIDYIVG